MRLLVVSQYFWPETFRINDLVAELVSRGHEVTVLTGEPNYPEGRIFADYLHHPENYGRHAGATVVRVPLIPRGRGSVRLSLNYLSFVVSCSLLALWRLRGERYDAIFVFQTSPITAALPALLLRRFKRAPLLMWVLDLWPDTLSAVGVIRSPRLLRWVGALAAYIYKRCDGILVQSQAFFPNIAYWSGDATRIRYFPAWAEAIFEGNLDHVEPAPEVTPYLDTFNIMFAGNIGEAQDFPAILNAAEHLRDRSDMRWLIVGDGRAAEEVRAKIVQRSLQDRVVMLGRHPLDRMPSFFRAANALLVSLKPEPVFGMTIPGKVQSYLAAGLPLLGMLDGEGARVIADARAGLVCPAGDGAALAKCAERLAALSVAERAAMGSRGRDYCRREFDRESLMTKLEQWLAELTQIGPMPGR